MVNSSAQFSPPNSFSSVKNIVILLKHYEMKLNTILTNISEIILWLNTSFGYASVEIGIRSVFALNNSETELYKHPGSSIKNQ
jgi:hypothetical protein